jgi:hypothetical protein
MQIKCRNVIALAATNMDELETEWDCLLDTQESGLMPAKPFVSKHFSTTLSDVCLSAIMDLSFVSKPILGNTYQIFFGMIASDRAIEPV